MIHTSLICSVLTANYPNNASFSFELDWTISLRRHSSSYLVLLPLLYRLLLSLHCCACCSLFLLLFLLSPLLLFFFLLLLLLLFILILTPKTLSTVNKSSLSSHTSSSSLLDVWLSLSLLFALVPVWFVLFLQNIFLWFSTSRIIKSKKFTLSHDSLFSVYLYRILDHARLCLKVQDTYLYLQIQDSFHQTNKYESFASMWAHFLEYFSAFCCQFSHLFL